MNSPQYITNYSRPAADRSWRIAIWVLLILVLANGLAAGLRTVADSDMGWHIATGRYVIEHHSIPSVDVLSYTAAGRPWIYPPFAGVILYLIAKVGGCVALSWFCALACVGTIGYLMRARTLPATALAMCAIEPIAFRISPRADLFNIVFLAVFFGELWAFQRGGARRLWILPVTMLLWVNLHPGFILGLAVIVAYLLLDASEMFFAERRSAARQRLRSAWPWLAATIAVTLLNPWGARIYDASFVLSGLGPHQQGTYSTSSLIGEFLSVPLNGHLLKQLVDFRHAENGFSWLMLAAVVVVILAAWRRQFGVAILQAAVLYLSLQHARYIALFCVATVILGASILEDVFREGSGAQYRRTRDGARWVLIGIVAIVTLLHTVDFVSNRTHVVFQSQMAFGAGEASWFPERAASFIRREQLPGNIYEEYGLGGFAAWRLGPQYPDFIDGRFDHLAPDVLVTERNLLGQAAEVPAWQAAADKWGINVLLLEEAATRAVGRENVAAFCHSANWRPVYMDEVSLVLVRNTEANRAWIDRLQIDCDTQAFAAPQSASRKQLYDYYTNAGGMLLALSRGDEAEAALLQAKALYPYDPNVRLSLAQIYMREGMVDKAEAEYREALAVSESDGAWFALGRIYTLQGRMREAEHAFQHAASLSVSPLGPNMALAQVEIALKDPDAALEAYSEAETHSPYRHGAEAQAPRLYADIADGRAVASSMLGRLPQAVAFAQEAVRLDGGSADRWNELAQMLEAAGRSADAQQARERANALAVGQGVF